MNIALFLCLGFFLTILLGGVLRKIRIPWIFGALLVGIGLQFFNIGALQAQSESFRFMADLGVYFLLFIIGFEINLRKFREQAKLVGVTALKIIAAETVVGALILFTFFNTSLIVSLVVAMSFATIGEAMLVPILDEFKLTKTRLGQVIFSVGVVDDIIEIAALVFATILISGEAGRQVSHIGTVLATLSFLLIAPFLMKKAKPLTRLLQGKSFESMFLGVIAVLFFFVGVGFSSDMAPLGAILAGVVAQNVVGRKFHNLFESEIRALSYGFFGPLFFIAVGFDTNLNALTHGFGLLLLLAVATALAKIITTFWSTRNLLGDKGALVAGVCFTVRLSSSIVLIKLLHDNGIIDEQLYSVLIGTTIIFKFITPFAISRMMSVWKKDLRQAELKVV